jgi:hypothetical protein
MEERGFSFYATWVLVWYDRVECAGNKKPMSTLAVPTCGLELDRINPFYPVRFNPRDTNPSFTQYTSDQVLNSNQCQNACQNWMAESSLFGAAKAWDRIRWDSCGTCMRDGEAGKDPPSKDAQAQLRKGVGCYYCGYVVAPWVYQKYGATLDAWTGQGDPPLIGLPTAEELRVYTSREQESVAQSNWDAFYALPACQQARIMALSCGTAPSSFEVPLSDSGSSGLEMVYIILITVAVCLVVVWVVYIVYKRKAQTEVRTVEKHAAQEVTAARAEAAQEVIAVRAEVAQARIELTEEMESAAKKIIEETVARLVKEDRYAYPQLHEELQKDDTIQTIKILTNGEVVYTKLVDTYAINPALINTVNKAGSLFLAAVNTTVDATATILGSARHPMDTSKRTWGYFQSWWRKP